MKTQKNTKTTQKRTPKHNPKPNDAGDDLSVATLARRYGVSSKTIARWRAAGAPLESPSDMETWLAQRRQLPAAAVPGLAAARLEETLERVRKLRLSNDRTAGALVSRAWVVEKIAIMCSQLDELEHRSISEHALRLAQAGDDPAQNRAVLRGVWSEIRGLLRDLGQHLKECDE